jgi:hypothetical protein
VTRNRAKEILLLGLTRQRLPENDQAQHRCEHEIGARVDDTDTDGTARQGESTCKKSPHDSVE